MAVNRDQLFAELEAHLVSKGYMAIFIFIPQIIVQR